MTGEGWGEGERYVGQVDLNFKPSVPVFDANVSIGRRHDKRVAVDTVDGALEEMQRAGIGRALVYSPHAAYWDPEEGNEILLEAVADRPSLVPQFVASVFDDLDRFARSVEDNGIRAVRMLPSLYKYAFRDWAVKPWLDWIASERLPLWLPVEYTTHVDQNYGRAKDLDPTEVYDTLSAHPDLHAVLCDFRDEDFPWVFLLLKSLPNLHLELSGYVVPDGIAMAMDAIGEDRILFGSRFPDAPMSPHLYHLHHYGLSESALRKICGGNLERLLGTEQR